jgi:hypothetical protein
VNPYRYRFVVSVLFWATTTLPLWAGEGVVAPRPVDFTRDIKPILTNNCYACHGPDTSKRRAGLRLDHRDEAVRTLKSGTAAVVPGDSARSALFQRISADDDGQRMPPPKSGKKLTTEQIDLLKRWLDAGAKWEDHWAFVKPVRPELPPVRNAAWPRNPIDFFILARLEEKGLQPSPEADRTTLLRRVTLDLTGLPPTPAEIDAFLADDNPEAYERVVDRLLASQHYGERMALQWLDLARYADTNGYHIDNHRNMWKYRDWVIDAFNNNKPFDQFTVEQLAGDLLPGATLDQKIATGFNRNTMVNFEGGADPDEYLTKYVGDRVTTTATVWLGLTIGCAECHDHKYDPITQREFYQFYAFFNNVPEKGLDGQKTNPVPSVKAPSERDAARLAELRSEVARLEKQQAALEAQADAQQVEWERTAREKLAADRALYQGYPAPTLTNWHVLGPFAAPDAPTAFATEFGPENDADLARTYQNGKLHWSERPAWQDGFAHSLVGDDVHYLFRTIYSPAERPLVLSLGTSGGLQVWLNGVKVFTRAAGRKFTPDQVRIKVNLRAGDNRLLLKINNLGGSGAFWFAPLLEPPSELPPAVVAVLSLPADKLAPAQQADLRNYFREKVWPIFPGIKVRIAELRKAEADVANAVPETMVMEEKPKLRDTFVLMRGDFRSKGEKVGAAVPASLGRLPEGLNPDRLALARWLVDPAHPLTSRVTVNRWWQMVFGTGLVKTANDFGTQGEPPSHPPLLDWLATEFSARRWDIKAFQKMIVMSATYRQSSKVTPQLQEADPYNRLLGRGPRFRLSAETIRDNALAVSGLLNRQVGGPSVYPYQPAGLWEEIAFGGEFSSQKYVQSHGADLYRRGLYTYWKRSLPYPSMAVFDAPNREVCTAQRPLTNTPLQALVLMNDPAYVEAARVLAQRTLAEGGPGTVQRLVFAFRLCAAREPQPRELSVLLQIYNKQLERYQKDPAAALKLVSIGESPRPADIDVGELAAWTAVGNILLNLDEVITKG